MAWCLAGAALVGCQRQDGSAPGSQGGEPAPAAHRGDAIQSLLPGPLLDLSQGQPPPHPTAWTDEHDARVREACTRCHLLPPADALARDAWAGLIATMGGYPVPAGMAPLTATEARLAVAYYERHAPIRLELPPLVQRTSERLSFRTEHFTAPGLERERLPTVSHVSILPVDHPVAPDVLLADLRTSTVMALSAWAPPARRRLRPVRDRLHYPAQVTLVDLDQDGHRDLLVAALGALNPTAEVLGGIWWARGNADSSFASPQRLGPALARAAAVRAGDLDGDGDLDLVAAAFGLHGPGQLVVVENAGGRTEFVAGAPRVLDERDGALAVELTDLDADGLLDVIALVAQEHEELVIHRNLGGLRFERRIAHKAPHPGWGYASLELLDLDGDGDLDLLVANGDTLDNDFLKPYHGVSWFECVAAFQYVEHRILDLPGCERATAGDLDGDGDLDVVAVSFLPQIPVEEWRARDLASVVWMERIGDDWVPHVLERAQCIHPAVAVGDVDGDGRLDIAVGNYVWIDPRTGPRQRADYLTVFFQVPQ